MAMRLNDALRKLFVSPRIRRGGKVVISELSFLDGKKFGGQACKTMPVLLSIFEGPVKFLFAMWLGLFGDHGHEIIVVQHG